LWVCSADLLLICTINLFWEKNIVSWFDRLICSGEKILFAHFFNKMSVKLVISKSNNLYNLYGGSVTLKWVRRAHSWDMAEPHHSAFVAWCKCLSPGSTGPATTREQKVKSLEYLTRWITDPDRDQSNHVWSSHCYSGYGPSNSLYSPWRACCTGNCTCAR
jgi:hypothetical protein